MKPAVLAALALAAAAPGKLTAEQDHARTMAMVGVAQVRPGVDGYDPTKPNYVNYAEAKVRPYRLPDPLLMDDGTPVRTARDWWTKRRPQIEAAFDREVYGRPPAHLPAVAWREIARVSETVDDVPAVTHRLVGRLDNRADPQIAVEIHLTLTTPAAARGRTPVILQLGFAEGFGDPTPKYRDGSAEGLPDWRGQVLRRGFAYAVISPTSVQADTGAGLTEGVIGLANHGRPRGPDDWGALRAWAWGASRALDYFATQPDLDAAHVAVEGLSRYGKAALVAMAYDRRFAVGLIGSSGAGGAKLLRRNFGEQTENLAASGEYHWMAPRFLAYAGPKTVDDLPVDAHELIALCAPRPVFVSVGAPKDDSWADPRGMFEAEVAAGPVYRLLGAKDLGTADYPPMETALTSGKLAFRQHPRGHSVAPNWPAFLDYAGRNFARR
jgi:hypothetical protein